MGALVLLRLRLEGRRRDAWGRIGVGRVGGSGLRLGRRESFFAKREKTRSLDAADEPQTRLG